MNSKQWVIALALCSAGAAAHADADGAALANKGNVHGAIACASCHGAQGEGTAAAGFPRLAGLPAAYLAAQLDSFAAKTRDNASMRSIANALNAAERQAVSHYYATLPAPTPLFVPNGPNAAGEMLVQRGRWPQNLPACAQCHAADGVGVGAEFPPLAGQPASYIAAQLHAWQKNRRAPGPLGLMPAVAGKLSDADIQAVAAYYAALPEPAAAANGSPP